MNTSIKRGDCHCGAVSWEAETPDTITVHECNCSICQRVGFLHLIVPKAKFRLLTGEDMIETYTFNTGVAQHYFCRRCGVKSFYIPLSNPDGYSLNLRCMDRAQFESINVVPLDGQNWEQHAHKLKHLSECRRPRQSSRFCATGHLASLSAPLRRRAGWTRMNGAASCMRSGKREERFTMTASLK